MSIKQLLAVQQNKCELALDSEFVNEDKLRVSKNLNCKGKCMLRMKSSYEVPPTPNFSSSCYGENRLDI